MIEHEYLVLKPNGQKIGIFLATYIKSDEDKSIIGMGINSQIVFVVPKNFICVNKENYEFYYHNNS